VTLPAFFHLTHTDLPLDQKIDLTNLLVIFRITNENPLFLLNPREAIGLLI